MHRVSAICWAEEAPMVIAEACERLGAGCQERNLASGRVAIDFWVDGDPKEASDTLAAVLRGVGAENSVETAEQSDDWKDALKRHHQPVTIGGRLYLRPPWVSPRDGFLDVVIDPGMAFGTGQHATTRGCLELLTRVPADGALLDLGCGSGVLAIAARRLGFSSARAVDLDPLAVGATIANSRANGVGLAVAQVDILHTKLSWSPTVTANLMSEVLLELAGLVGPPVRRMILSGLMDDEAPEVIAAYERLGLGLADSVSADGWTSALVVRA